MDVKKLLITLTIVSFAFLTTCGGGGGGADTTSTDTDTSGGTDTATDTDTSDDTDTATDTDTDTINVGEKITVTGTLDDSTITFAPKSPESLYERIVSWLFPKSATAQGSATSINRVVAIGRGRTIAAITEGTRTGSQFQLSLNRNDDYILAFLDGTDTVGIHLPDEEADLDVIPPSDSAVNIDLQTVSLNHATGRSTHSLNRNSFYTGIGRSSSIGRTIGTYDNEMTRLASLDVDGNGVLDYKEGKLFDFMLEFMFYGGSFSSIVGNWSDKDILYLRGYDFWLTTQESLGFDWANMTMNSPAPINGSASNVTDSQAFSYDEYWYQDNIAAMCYLCQGQANTPATPPAGTYTFTDGSTELTFNNFKSITLDSELNNLFIPSIRLTLDDNGHVTFIEWQYWKKVDNVWQEVTDSELTAVVDSGVIQLRSGVEEGWDDLILHDIDVSHYSSGSGVPPSQGFATTFVYFNYTSRANITYGFEFGEEIIF